MSINAICNYQADYSKVLGERILPFLFSLDVEKSILEPAAGEYQRFCYQISGVGQDTSQAADLSHFLLGICDKITQEDIVEITVTIEEEPQEVIWGENIEIKTIENPDNPTGCTGLKFDFPLDKVSGVMEICISLRTPYPVGPVNICLFGGGTTATGLTICGPVCDGGDGCTSIFYQRETVCVPVRVTPFATSGTARATCCGEPVINTAGECVGRQTSCSFTVSQSLCIEIPISFGANVETGTLVVQCGDVSETGCNCSVDLATVRSTTAKSEEQRGRRFLNR